MNSDKKELSSEQREELLETLKVRFEKNRNRHKSLEWAKVQAKLEADTEKLWPLNEMERTGGEPDVVDYDKKTEVFVTTAKRWKQGKPISQKILRWIWLLPWVLSF